MKTIEQIKQECIDIDYQNVLAGDASIGQFLECGKFIQFRNLAMVELFYHELSIKKLLEYYSSYNGLSQIDEGNKADYAIDINSLLKYL